ncbi:nucleotidyltransferase family protein [Fibrobacterota bacterium]
MINVTEKHLETVKRILASYIPDVKVVVFGSRVQSSVKKQADLDLAVMDTEPIPSRTMALMRTEFSESRLPFKVDVLDWNEISGSFRKEIEKNYEVLQ